MKNIKTKENINKSIKVLNKSLIVADKTKDALVVTKEKIDSISTNENSNEYGSEKVKYGTIKASDKIIDKTNKIGKDNFIKTKDNIKSKIKEKSKSVEKSNIVLKKKKQVAKETASKSKAVAKKSKELVEKAYKTSKDMVKATVKAIKGMIAATKTLISALIAGGWISVIIIVIICFIGLIVTSIFGIFFSNDTGSKTMTQIIRETNNEVYNKIELLKTSNKCNEIEVEETYSNWEEVIAVYSVKYSEDGKNNITVLDETNERNLKNVFYDFNSISSKIEHKTEKRDYEDPAERDILIIKVNSKSKEDVMKEYNFTEEQIKEANELLSSKYEQLWLSLIYGSTEGNKQIVEIAKQQVGNVGGEPYWRWYGYDHRVEWCAVFVSWCANEAGLIEKGIIPKTAGVYTGIDWFKARGEWKGKEYVPRPGDIIYFDWEQDGKPNHVGIVEKVENNNIYTIEGNSTDDGCREKSYVVNSKYIYGFGLPSY